VTRLRITVAGTSLLLPGNPAWEVLQRDHHVVFGDFADWTTLLFQAPPPGKGRELLALMVFLQDVISGTSFSLRYGGRELSEKEMDELLSPVLLAIEHRLNAQPANPFIVAWSNAEQPSAIPMARRVPFWDALASRWESALRQRQTMFPSLFLLPADRFFAIAGREKCFDARNYYAAHCRLSPHGIAALAGGIAEIAGRLASPPKKVLALDCDNTLWGGVIGEDGLGGIRLGQDGVGAAYRDFQAAVRRLRHEGVLLTLVSKNNEADVWQVFDEHADMVLRRQDLIAPRVNWKDKRTNILELAVELGLGLDSIVFWDDNPLEREALRGSVPEITVPEVPVEVWRWPSWLGSSPWFAAFEHTDEDSQRGEMYLRRAQFQTEITRYHDEADFLRSIRLQPSWVAVSSATIARAVQLTAKTNQFNLRTCRYDEAGLSGIAAEPRTVAFLGHLQDKFGDHGNVGLVIARTDGRSKIAFLDTFLLSCRVLGRHFEAWMLHQCVARLRLQSTEVLVAEFIPSGRNQVAAGFLQEHGLTGASDCDALLRREIQPWLGSSRGQVFAARLSEIRIPHLDLFPS
jgi:FkbH-like protein